MEADAGQSALELVIMGLLVHLAVVNYHRVVDHLVEHFFCADFSGCTPLHFDGESRHSGNKV
jgi:hypothetical protein